MSIFCFKKLPAADSLGQKLRARREERNIAIVDIAKITQIQKKYLEALERGVSRKLPASKTFRLAYVREYARVVGLNPAECQEQYEQEGGLDDIAPVHPHPGINLAAFASIGSALRFGLIIGGVVLFGAYLTTQVARIVRPPRLIVYAPMEGEVVASPQVLLQGETERESKLSINGQETTVNEQGKFETKVDLTEGVSTITISATQKHGKTTTLTRHVIVRFPRNADQLSLKGPENGDRMGL